jgi:hypothetical protein
MGTTSILSRSHRKFGMALKIPRKAAIAALKIEEARLEATKTEAEAKEVEYLRRWAQNPKVRDSICRDRLSKEERAQ